MTFLLVVGEAYFMRNLGSSLLAGGILFILGLSYSPSTAQRFPSDGPGGAIEIVPSTLGGWGKPSFSADGRLAVIGNGNGAQLWDLQKNRLVRTFTGLGSINTTVALSADGTRVAAGAGKSIIVWDISTGRVEATFNLLMGIINGIAFSKDGTRLFYGEVRSETNPILLSSMLTPVEQLRRFTVKARSKQSTYHPMVD